MWYQSPLIGPLGLGSPELQSIAAAQFLVMPDFGPTGMAVMDGGSSQPTGAYTGFSLYSHSYSPHFPPPQFYPTTSTSPSSILQFSQFHTQMTTMADSSHSVSQIHSPTPHTCNQSYPGHLLHYQFTPRHSISPIYPSNSPERFSQASVHFVPSKTTITPPTSPHIPWSFTTTTQIPGILYPTPKPQSVSHTVDVACTKPTATKASQKLAPATGGVRKPQCFRRGSVALRLVKKYQKSTKVPIHKDPLRRLKRESAQNFKTNLRFHNNAVAAEGRNSIGTTTPFEEFHREFLDELRQLRSCVNPPQHQLYHPPPPSSTAHENSPPSLSNSKPNPIICDKSGGLKPQNTSKSSIVLPHTNIHQQRFKQSDQNLARLPLQGLFNERLHKSVLVAIFEVFLSLPYTYHNWRARLDWFLAAMIQCSLDPNMFIENLLLGDFGGRLSLYVSSRMRRSLYIERDMKIQDNGESHASQFYQKMVEPMSALYLRHLVEQGRKSDNWLELICINGLNSTAPVSIEFKLINFNVGCWSTVQFTRVFIKLFMKDLDLDAVMQNIAEVVVGQICGAYDTVARPAILSRGGGIVTPWNLNLQFFSLQFCRPSVNLNLLQVQFCSNNKGGFTYDLENWIESTTRNASKLSVRQATKDSSKIDAHIFDQENHFQQRISFGLLKSNLGLSFSRYFSVLITSMVSIGTESTVQTFLHDWNLQIHQLGGHMVNNIDSIALYYGYYEHKQLKLAMVLGLKSIWIILDNYHTSVFRNLLLLLTAPAKYIHVLQEFKGLIDWKLWQGYQVVGIVAFGLHSFSITKHLQQYRSLKIIQRKFSLEGFQVYNSNFALQTNEQLIHIKTKLSDWMHMTKHGNKMLDYEMSVGIDVNYSIPVVVLGLIRAITIWFSTFAYLVHTATLLIEGDDGRHELSNKGTHQVVESSFFKKNIVQWVQWIGAAAWKTQKRLWLQLGTSFICSGKELLGSPFWPPIIV